MLKQQRTKLIYVLLLALLAVAYLADLGYGNLDNETDEGRRALVAAEMMISGNYITPTLQGNIYLNKPPLYNWIIAGSFKLFGNYSMFALRFPVIVSVFISGFIIFYFAKRYTKDFNVAFFSAFIYMSNGRILIYDSLQGLIDITFGWVIFLSFMLIYHYGKREKYLLLFLSSYLLTAVGYMMKGLPAIACQGITLLVYFIYTKRFKKLFSLQHFVGIICFLLPLAVYYFEYFSVNKIAPLTLFENLLNESSKRTVVGQGVGETVLHLFTFPFELMYHFLPWTILILVLINNKFKQLWQNEFIRYNAIIFLANIVIYWTSPQVYARYLFMLMPLFFNVVVYAFFTITTELSWQRKTIESVFTFFTFLLGLASLYIPFMPQLQHLPLLWPKALFAAAAMLALAYLMVKRHATRLLAFAFALCFFRIAFNWFVVENRGVRYTELKQRGDRIVEIAQHKPLYILEGANIGEFLDGLTFHIITQRNQLLVFKPLVDYNALYIADDEQLKHKKYKSLLAFDNYGSAHLQLVQVRR